MNWYKTALNQDIFYHASPMSDLGEIGISPEAMPHISREPQGYVYLGTLSYVLNDYMDYAKEGNYYIYKVDTTGLNLLSDLTEGQVRTKDFIDPERIVMIDQVQNKPSVHPEEQNYLDWYENK
jgi:hypothetical protein